MIVCSLRFQPEMFVIAVGLSASFGCAAEHQGASDSSRDQQASLQERDRAGHALDADAGVVVDWRAVDLASTGHDLDEGDPIGELSQVHDVVSRVPSEHVPPAAFAELEAAARDAFIAKSIIGKDNRRAVSDTGTEPYKTVVRLFVQREQGGGHAACSGTLIAPDAVLTAAHCVYDSKLSPKGYAYSVTAVPALELKVPRPTSGKPYEAPFGSASGKKLFVPSQYVSTERNLWNRIEHDYAVVRLKSSFGRVGTKAFGVMPNPLNVAASLIGYHFDKNDALQMYESHDQIRKVLGNGTLNHYMDMRPGASGGPIVGAGGWENKVFAINSSELEGIKPYNIATAITTSNRPVIATWSVRAL
jgi:glutamyl endopeptidase